jgi:DNA-binding transcriptional regulator YiaG
VVRTPSSRHRLTPETVRAVRTGLYLTQEDFAALLGVSRRTVIRWERGEHLPVGTYGRKHRAAFHRLWHRYKEWLAWTD